MAFSGITNAHGPSPQPTLCRSPTCSLTTATGCCQALGKVWTLPNAWSNFCAFKWNIFRVQNGCDQTVTTALINSCFFRVTVSLSRESVWPDWVIYCTLGNFAKPMATIILPKSPTFLGNFCKCVKTFHFYSEVIFGQLL